jgi:hypothetical protein
MAVFSHITFRFSRGVSSGKKTPIGRKVLYCQKYHNLAETGLYASVGELGDDMRQEN